MQRRRALQEDPIDLAKEHWRAHGWSQAADGMGVLTSVMRVQQIMLAEVEDVVRPFGLTFARYEVLMLLFFSRRGSLPLGKIGERLQVHAASVTNAVDRLERDGLVRRVPNPNDGRSMLAALTAKGRRVLQQATGELNERVFSATGLAPATTGQLYGLLREFRHTAGDFI
jgi:DNA-binding MarR family transcriptional regulator